MSDPKSGIAPTALAEMSQMTADDLRRLLSTKLADYSDMTIGEFVLAGPDAGGLHPYSDALIIEIARQMSDASGLPLTEAMRLVSYTGAVEGYDEYRQYPDKVEGQSPADTDFWVAVAAARNSWRGGVRGSVPVTSFGPNEYWLTAHYHGTFAEVTAAIKDRMNSDNAEYPDTDFARVFMTNISAADRRLRKRV